MTKKHMVKIPTCTQKNVATKYTNQNMLEIQGD